MPNSTGIGTRNASPIKFKRIGIVAGAIISVLTLTGVGFKGLVWAADQRYSTHKDLDAAFVQQRLQTLEDLIFKLELKVQYNEASNSDVARLSKYIREREQLLKGK